MFKKTLISLAIAVLSNAAVAGISLPLDHAAAEDLEHAQVNRLLALESVGERLVAVGRRGHILMSADQGQSWQQQPVPVASDLVASQFIDEQLGWAVGHDGVVLRSRDAGNSWQKVLDGRKAAELIAEYRKSHTELSEDAVMEYERFEAEGSDKPFLTVHFSDENNGVVLGAFNYAFSTADGGETWVPFSHRIENPTGYHIYSAFEHQGVLYAVGEKGLLLRWSAEIERLEAVESPYEGSWFGGVSLGQQMLLYGLRGSVYAGSPESGWQQVELDTEDSFNSAVAISSDAALLVGQSGKVFRIDRLDGVFSSRELGSAGGMPLYDLELSGDALVLVGARGVRQLSLRNDK
jgi:photosystem II stability/assembly factor-like uncharacterized protein